MGLVITKQTGNFFSLKLNDETPIISEQNRLTTVGDLCHFKTISGANIIKEQNISYSDITLVASGSFTFTSVNALWLKLIEVGFFDGLGAGGSGGTGTDRFTELSDTFNSYIGRDGQVFVVNESQQKIETVPFSNVSKFTDLSDTPSPLLTNKMIVTNATGTSLIMTDLPSEPQQYLNAVGSFHYASTEQPLALVANVDKKLTNDALGEYTNTTNAPYGVSSVWNSIDNDFNFNEMSLGDLIHLRVDLAVTTNTSNQNVKLYLKLGIGTDSEFDLTISQDLIKTSGEHPIVSEVCFDLGYQDIVDAPAEIYLLSDGSGTVKVNGWYLEIVRKNINVVDIVADLGYVPENIDNKQNNLLPDGQGVKYPTVDAVNDGLKVDTGASPSVTTVAVGGIPAGTNIQNMTFETLLTDILIAYLYPQFTSAICTYPTTNGNVEVGTTVSGSYVFNWAISNPTNVKANTVAVYDINTSTNIASVLNNDGSEAVTLNNALLNANNATQKWYIKAQNTKDEFIQSAYITVTAIYPIFYGKSNTQPTANQSLIDSGTKAIVASTSTLNITFGASGQYLWFAHPAINTTKTKWYVNALNNGNIGSISDLFGSPTTVSITTVMWAGVSYKIYISNVPTTTSGNMELKNS